MSVWPKLSKTLTGPKSPQECQSCGKPGVLDAESHLIRLQRWREHDANDQPTLVVVVLCPTCADKLIEKHPRLYSAITVFTPIPGSMPMCVGCVRRDGTACTHPSLKSNGGEGLAITGPKPTTVHVLRRGKGQRSGWEQIYRGWPRECAGREGTPLAETDQ